MSVENPALVRASRSALRRVLSGRGASDVNGQAVPAAAERPCLTSDAGPRPAVTPPQREGLEATENVQGSQQASRGRSGRRRLHRARQQMGQSVSDRARRRPRGRHRQVRAMARGPAPFAACAGRIARTGSRVLLRGPRACHGDLLLRLANATREVRVAWWRTVKAAA